MSDPIVIVAGLGKRYAVVRQSEKPLEWLRKIVKSLCLNVRNDNIAFSHWALKDVSFKVNRGERIGIIGKNGAGKSTLLKIMSRVSYPTEGEIRVRGSITSLLEVGTGFVDNLSGRENIFLNASLHGLTRTEINEKFDDIVAFSEVGQFIDTPIKNYSSGMRMRLAFSVAAHLEPDILLLDEVLAVGDMSFQRKCLQRVEDLTSKGQTLIFVSHSIASVMSYCNRCIWLDAGKLRMDGDAEFVCASYVEDLASRNVDNELKRSFSGASVLFERKSSPTEVPLSAIHSLDCSVAPSVSTVKLMNDSATISSPIVPDSCQEGPKACLVSASVINEMGQVKNMHRVSDKFGIEIVYEILKSGMYTPGIQLICPEGNLAFVSVPPVLNPKEYYHEKAGQYIAQVWFTPHLLNIGLYSVTVSLFSADENPFKRHFKKEHLLTFQTIEPGDGELSAKGCLPRPLPGATRPKLNWKVAAVEQ